MLTTGPIGTTKTGGTPPRSRDPSRACASRGEVRMSRERLFGRRAPALVLPLLFAGLLAPGIAAKGGANVCVDIKDKNQVQKGTATCAADDTSRAVVVGAGSDATATDQSVARVIGE